MYCDGLLQASAWWLYSNIFNLRALLRGVSTSAETRMSSSYNQDDSMHVLLWGWITADSCRRKCLLISVPLQQWKLMPGWSLCGWKPWTRLRKWTSKSRKLKTNTAVSAPHTLYILPLRHTFCSTNYIEVWSIERPSDCLSSIRQYAHIRRNLILSHCVKLTESQSQSKGQNSQNTTRELSSVLQLWGPSRGGGSAVFCYAQAGRSLSKGRGGYIRRAGRVVGRVVVGGKHWNVG